MKLKYLLPVVALAATEASAEINFNGFATIAGGLTLDDNQQYAGYNEDIDFSNDSLFGLQMTADLDDDLTFTAQMVSRANEDWNTQVEWAYFNYQVNDNFRLTVGKQRPPIYMYTEFLDVGYAYNWITPPEGVYDLPINSGTGISALVDGSSGDLYSSFQLFYGRHQEEIVIDGVARESDMQDMISAAWVISYDWFTFRLSHTDVQGRIEIEELTPLVDGWNQTPFLFMADELLIDDNQTFDAAGFTIDLDPIQLIGEYTKLDSGESLLANQTSYFLSMSYRVSDFVFHLTHGVDEDDNELGSLVGVPTGVSPTLDFLIDSTQNAINSRIDDSEYTTLGMRWDFSSSAAFKIEYTDYTNNLSDDESQLVRLAISTAF